MPTISALYTYPIKSCGSLTHDAMALDARGLLWDRHWMLVEASGKAQGMFISGRDVPRLALVQPRFEGDTLVVSAPTMPDLRVALMQDHQAPRMTVVIWRDICEAVDSGEQASVWFSTFLGRHVRLVAMADTFTRLIDNQYVQTPTQTGFSDGFPLLTISEASLADVNMRLLARGKAPVKMSAFRPNIVVQDTAAYDEDTWRTADFGTVPFEIVKPCKRCQMVTIDWESGDIPNPKEPTATLASYRRWNEGVIFGQNIVHRGIGKLHVGDTVTVHSVSDGWITSEEKDHA